MSDSRRAVVLAAVTVVVLAALLALWIALCPYFWTNVGWVLWQSWFWLLPLIVLAVVALGLFALTDSAGIAGTIGVLGFIAIVFYGGWVHSYQQDSDYASSATQVDNGLPAFAQRAPYNVAEAQIGSNLGDVNGDVVANSTAYLPASGHYGTLVTARGALVGYEGVLDQTMPLTGHGTGKFCAADASGAQDGGWFGHNLGRRIAEIERGVSYDSGDVYGYCDDRTGHAMVVVPLKSQAGFFVVTERPAGVAVYDTITQALDIRANSAGLPGPSYPLSLAKAQRAALPALGTLTDYWFNRAGYEPPAGEVNSAGTNEFVLGTVAQNDHEYYVTPLSGRGSSQSVAAFSTISAGAADGGLAPLVIHRLTAPNWTSIANIEKRIQGDYQTLPNWQLMGVAELAPIDNAHWVATITNGQNINYRVTGAGDLSGTTCLQRVEGDALVDVQCGPVTNTGGNGPGPAVAPAGQPGAASAAPAAPGSDPLAGYSNDQLIGEVQRRLAAAGAPR